MDREHIIAIVLVILIIGLSITMYFESDYFQLICIISDVNGKKYCVRDRKELDKAANLLANTTENLNKLVEHLRQNHGSKENVSRLIKNYNPKAIKEILPTSEYTAYSENKGEKIAFCLNKDNKEDVDGKLIDINTLMFVALHELSHIATKSVGHTDEFWSNFKFILEESVAIRIYSPEDYKNNETSYCGMDINDNPLYDYKG